MCSIFLGVNYIYIYIYITSTSFDFVCLLCVHRSGNCTNLYVILLADMEMNWSCVVPKGISQMKFYLLT